MKNLILTNIILGFSIISLASFVPNPTSNNPNPEQKFQWASEFIREYDKTESVVDWKIKIKKNRVVISKRWSLQRIVLYNTYFANKLQELKKNETD